MSENTAKFLKTYATSMLKALRPGGHVGLNNVRHSASSDHAVICVHGLYQSPAIMMKIVEALSRNPRLDIHIFGYAAWGTKTTEAETASLLAHSCRALKAKGIRRITFVGHSLGGRISALAASELTDEFRLSMVYIGSPVNGARSAVILAKCVPGVIIGRLALDLKTSIQLPDIFSLFLLGMQHGINRSVLSRAPGDGVVFDSECLPKVMPPHSVVEHIRAGHTDILWKQETVDIVKDFASSC